jgi:hypothetical protein
MLGLLGTALMCLAHASASGAASHRDAEGNQKFRLLRSLSGSKGQESGGRFIIEDPRAVFQIPEDKQILVYFEWQGPPGLHHVECSWKNPEAKVVSSATLDQPASPQGRFGAYWSMPLTEKTTPGLWALEARVDGELAGVHTIQVTTGPLASGLPTRHLLSPGDVYKRATAGTVFVEKQDPLGKPVASGSGFFVGDGAVLTTFQVIDGASALVLKLPDGRRVPANEVIAWNRWQDWALLKAASGPGALERAPERSWVVGDRCFSLDTSVEGSRVIVDLSIAGRTEGPKIGERLILSGQVSSVATGSPLLNEYGEAIGIVGVGLLPGADSMEMAGPRGYGTGMVAQALLATPIELVTHQSDSREAIPLADLAKSGEFLPLLTARRHVFQASFGRKVQAQGPAPSLVDQGREFSRRDGQIILWVMWDPKERLKTTLVLRVYDLNNTLVGQTKPGKLDLQRGPYSYTYWPLDISKFPPATYRVDIVIGTEAAWRGYLKVNE